MLPSRLSTRLYLTLSLLSDKTLFCSFRSKSKMFLFRRPPCFFSWYVFLLSIYFWNTLSSCLRHSQKLYEYVGVFLSSLSTKIWLLGTLKEPWNGDVMFARTNKQANKTGYFTSGILTSVLQSNFFCLSHTGGQTAKANHCWQWVTRFKVAK